MTRTLWTAAIALLLMISRASGDWKEPADKKFTEDQLKLYLATANDWMDQSAKMLKAMQDAKTDAAKIAAVGNIDEQYQAVLDRHQISKPEYEWLGQRALQAWGATVVADEIIGKSMAQLKDQQQQNDDKLAEAQKQLAAYQAAAKDGRRMMPPEDKDSAIKSAKDDQQSATDEAKQHSDEAKAAGEEAAKFEADAGAADDLAKNPPSDIAADDRQKFIDTKKAEAQTARDSARDARKREMDAKAAQQDSVKRATAAEARAKNPDEPLTDDDKAAVKSENEAGITRAQDDIAQCTKARDQLKQEGMEIEKAGAKLTADVPVENVALIRKYKDDYKNLLTRIGNAGAATQPAKQ